MQPVTPKGLVDSVEAIVLCELPGLGEITLSIRLSKFLVNLLNCLESTSAGSNFAGAFVS